MKRLIMVALAATALCSPACARDYWNGSGFPLDHNFHSPYDNIFGPGGDYLRPPGYQPNARVIHVPPGYGAGQTDQDVEQFQEDAEGNKAREEEARQKAIEGQRICAPVVLYTDEGRIVHRALGCRR